MLQVAFSTRAPADDEQIKQALENPVAWLGMRMHPWHFSAARLWYLQFTGYDPLRQVSVQDDEAAAIKLRRRVKKKVRTADAATYERDLKKLEQILHREYQERLQPPAPGIREQLKILRKNGVSPGNMFKEPTGDMKKIVTGEAWEL